MRTVRRLRLRFLLLRPGDPNPNGFYIAGLSISLLLTLSKLCRPDINTLCQNVYGGPGGIRTPVQNPFQSTSYSLNSYLPFTRCQGTQTHAILGVPNLRQFRQ